MLLFSVSAWQRRMNDVNMFICKKNAEKRRINIDMNNIRNGGSNVAIFHLKVTWFGNVETTM